MHTFHVATFFPPGPIEDHPFTKEPYRQAYFDLSQAVTAQGGQLFIVRGQDSYQGSGQFSRGWLMDAPDAYTEITAPRATVVYDKGRFVPDHGLPVFNHPGLSELCSDKFLNYQRFSEFCPLTFLTHSPAELTAAFQNITTERVVVKPVRGFEGRSVHIGTVAELSELTHDFPVLVQEFMDTSQGIPGIIEGIHDVRLAFFNEDILFSYVRTPPLGKLTANVAQGGTFRMIHPSRIPAEMVRIARQIDATVAHYGPRLYSVDMCLTPQGPKLIEMNSRLGLRPNRDGAEFVELKKRLAQVFQELSESPSSSR